MDTLLVVSAVALVVLALLAVLAVRRGWVYRSPRYVEWRKAKSRRDRGKARAGGPSDGGATDPTAGF